MSSMSSMRTTPSQDTHPRAKKRRAQKLAQALRKPGYSVTLTEVNPGTVPAANA